MLAFTQRCRIESTDTSLRRIWRSSCGRFRVVQSHCRFGPRKGRQAIPDRYTAEVHDELGWTIVSSHRGKQRAVDACQRAARALSTQEVTYGPAKAG